MIIHLKSKIYLNRIFEILCISKGESTQRSRSSLIGKNMFLNGVNYFEKKFVNLFKTNDFYKFYSHAYEINKTKSKQAISKNNKRIILSLISLFLIDWTLFESKTELFQMYYDKFTEILFKNTKLKEFYMVNSKESTHDKNFHIDFITNYVGNILSLKFQFCLFLCR